MKKIFDFYRFVYESKGPSVFLFLAVVLGALGISIYSYIGTGQVIGIVITCFLILIYHVAFIMDYMSEDD